MNDRDSLAHIDALRVGVGMDGRDSLARNDAAHVGIEEQGREDLADIDALRVEMKDPIGLADFDALHVEMKDGDGLADFDALRVGVWGNPSAAKRIPVPSSWRLSLMMMLIVASGEMRKWLAASAQLLVTSTKDLK
jgi:hypothetical protein